MSNSNRSGDHLSFFVIKLSSITALTLVLAIVMVIVFGIINSRTDGTETPLLSENHELNLNIHSNLSALAVEGRDVFQEEGCSNCHSGEIKDASLLLAGGLFAPQHPFKNTNMDVEQLSQYLAGPAIHTDEGYNDKFIQHSPLFSHLEHQSIDGNQTQAKMLLQPQMLEYSQTSLVEASATTAGASKLEALISYLQEESEQNE